MTVEVAVCFRETLRGCRFDAYMCFYNGRAPACIHQVEVDKLSLAKSAAIAEHKLKCLEGRKQVLRVAALAQRRYRLGEGN